MYQSSAKIPLFSEEQRFRHPLLQILISILVAMNWLLLIYQVFFKRPFGGNRGVQLVLKNGKRILFKLSLVSP
jgi:hypothetical protein